MSKCFFIGHRDAPNIVKPLLLDAIYRHIDEYGVTEFFVGHYGAFDRMAAEVLCEIKKSRPHIVNYLLLAYHPAVKKVDIPEGFESTVLFEGQEKVPPRLAIARINERMIVEADYLISYVNHITDGSYKVNDVAKARAKKGEIFITNLAE